MSWISPLQLKDYVLISLHVDANRELIFRANAEYETEIVFDFDFNKKNDESLFQLRLNILINQDEKIYRQAPYRINIILHAVFEIKDKELSEETIQGLLMPSGLAMTYSIARGIVGQTTGTSLHGKYLLPTVNFTKVLEDKARQEARSKNNVISKVTKTVTSKSKK